MSAASAPAHAPRPVRWRRTFGVAVLATASAAALYGLLPRLAGVHDGWDRIDSADPWWLLGALILECLSYVGYVMLFGLVLAGRRIDATTAWLTTIAGVAATRLIAAGGAGGIALTAWVLRRAGEDARAVAAGLTAFLVLLYSVYTAALVVGGVGLLTGLWPGPAPVAPCVLAVAVGGGIIVLALGLAAIAPLVRSDATDGWRGALGAIPSGIRDAIAVARRRDRRLLGAPAWWGFDIATLAACLAAFGEPPAPAALVVAYFVGMLGNLLPLPGGVGGVDGGLIAALIAFGVDPGLAFVGVFSYRVFSFWLPTVAGVPAYLALVRRVHRWDVPVGLGRPDGD